MIARAAARRQALPDGEKLIAQYGCGPVRFSGTDEALHERHLLFDSGAHLAAATARDLLLAPLAHQFSGRRWPYEKR